MSYQQLRSQMVKTQLIARDITDPHVIMAFKKVPREKFVPSRLMNQAYHDHPLPIGEDQTISQPYVVAKMCQLLKLKGDEKVLDVGTGSGYQAAILSKLVKKVISLETIVSLALNAKKTLQEIGCNNVEVYQQDAKFGFSTEAPFDAIVSAASSAKIPQTWKSQLAVNGRIVMPLKRGSHQELVRITRLENKWKVENFGSVAFVPLV